MENIFLPLHLLTLAFVAWNVVSADHMAFNWIRGKVNTLDETVVAKYHKRTWAGLILMIVTGFVLFWPMKDFLLTRPQFYVKMGFVAALFINSFAIGKLQKTAETKSYASLTFKEKLPLFISGAISTIGWLGATAGGFFLIPD